MFKIARALLVGVFILAPGLCLTPSMAQAQTVTTVATLPEQPGDIEQIGSDILVVSYTRTLVWRVTPGGTVTTFATLSSGTFRRGLTLGHDGAYYATVSGDLVVRISTGGVISTFASSPVGPTGMTYSAAAGGYFIVNQTGDIFRLTTAGVLTTYATVPGQTFDAVIADAAGNLYLAGRASGNVYKITTSGAPTTTLVGTVGAGVFFDLVRDGAGDFYLLNYSGPTVRKLTSTGTASTYVPGAPLSNPFRAGIVNGDLHVTDLGTNNLLKITGIAPPTPAPAPVPTMSEWAMILLGLVMAGGAALYIQRRQMTAG